MVGKVLIKRSTGEDTEEGSSTYRTGNDVGSKSLTECLRMDLYYD